MNTQNINCQYLYIEAHENKYLPHLKLSTYTFEILWNIDWIKLTPTYSYVYFNIITDPFPCSPNNPSFGSDDIIPCLNIFKNVWRIFSQKSLKERYFSVSESRYFPITTVRNMRELRFFLHAFQQLSLNIEHTQFEVLLRWANSLTRWKPIVINYSHQMQICEGCELKDQWYITCSIFRDHK